MNDSYEDFVDIIEQGRNMTEAEVKKVADGRIVNGRQAVEAGLADEIGFVREEIGALGIVTGESLGQVASQTLESLTAINAVSTTPIFRPLTGKACTSGTITVSFVFAAVPQTPLPIGILTHAGKP